MIIDAVASGEGSVTQEYIDYTLMYDWGLSYQEYMNTPLEVIAKMKTYLQARNIGENERNNKK